MRFALLTLMGLALASPVMVGCDRQVSHSQETHTNPITGNQTTEEKSTYQKPNGQTYTNSSEKTAPANNNP